MGRHFRRTQEIRFFAARPSRDLIIAAHQQLTYDWWQCRSEYELVVSELVVTEASKGDSSVAEQRLALLEGVHRLALSEQTHSFAQELVSDLDWASSITHEDIRKVYPERRFITLAYLNERLHVVCYALIADGIRVISFRKANKRERKDYESRTTD